MSRIIVLFVLALVAKISLAGDSSGNLLVHVSGLLSERGQVIANIFRDGEDVMKAEMAFLRMKADISDKQAQLVIPNLEYGRYAIIVFHDENGNGNLDHNWLRIPSEPLGFSNGFEFGLLPGIPSFEKLQFVFGPGKEIIYVTVK